MPLSELEPPSTLPRGHWCTSPPLCACGVVSYAQSTSVPQSAGHIGGWWIASSVSGPPASRTTTRALPRPPVAAGAAVVARLGPPVRVRAPRRAGADHDMVDLRRHEPLPSLVGPTL